MKRPFEIRVVLVRSIYERNVGAVSRAMSNMGVEKLILIDPKCEITFEAQQAAATGQSALQNRTVYKNWDEFYQSEPESIQVAFTARDGRGRQVRDIAEVLTDVQSHSPQFQVNSEVAFPVHFIFGPEDWGLSGSDLDHVNFCASIPTFGENWSLNLAQAVLLGLYTMRLSWGGSRTQLDGEGFRRITNEQDRIKTEGTLKLWLEEMGFDLTKKRINVFTILRRMLLQNTPTTKELVILETVLQQSIRKLKEWKELNNRQR